MAHSICNVKVFNVGKKWTFIRVKHGQNDVDHIQREPRCEMCHCHCNQHSIVFSSFGQNLFLSFI
eukprot:03877.XXX_61612_61806_1 [CDS] Oithona nana genome sequencing.